MHVSHNSKGAVDNFSSIKQEEDSAHICDQVFSKFLSLLKLLCVQWTHGPKS